MYIMVFLGERFRSGHNPESNPASAIRRVRLLRLHSASHFRLFSVVPSLPTKHLRIASKSQLSSRHQGFVQVKKTDTN